MKQLFLIAVTLLGASFDASAQNKFYWGEGNALCSEWTKERVPTITPAGATLGAWFRGFVSGANVMQAHMDNIFDNNTASMDAMTNWMAGYCAGHPNDKLIVGADLLVKSIITQNRKS